MLTLYYAPGGCSLAPHIALREAGLAFSLEQVDKKTRKTKSGEDYLATNPHGYIPALKLDDGQILTEGPAILQWIADQNPASHLAPANASFERYRLQEWLGFISTELHKTYFVMFDDEAPEAYKAVARKRILARYAVINGKLKHMQYLMGERFTVADAYFFTVTNWAAFLQIDLSDLRDVTRCWDRVHSRPKVLEALKAEGLAW